MDNNQFKSVLISAVAAVLVALIVLVGGYTKALNDQRYVEIVSSEMSEQGFEEFMENKQMHGMSW